MLKLVSKKLQHHPFNKVIFPDEKKQFAAMIQSCEHLVDDIIGFMDGVVFGTECTDEKLMQNGMYCGYDCDTMSIIFLHMDPMVKCFVH